MRAYASNARREGKKDSYSSFAMIPVIVISILFLDQASKFFILKNLSLNESIPVIKGVFHLTLVFNRGAAFGILKNQLPLFIFTAVISVILITLSLKESRGKKVSVFSLSLILAGALGNLADRIFFGYVIDFLDFRIWPVFNVADCAITAGAILFGWAILFRGRKNKPVKS
ncbi:MAG: signal peptidase II [Candidatus Omnitrophota bacterium]